MPQPHRGMGGIPRIQTGYRGCPRSRRVPHPCGCPRSRLWDRGRISRVPHPCRSLFAAWVGNHEPKPGAPDPSLFGTWKTSTLNPPLSIQPQIRVPHPCGCPRSRLWDRGRISRVPHPCRSLFAAWVGYHESKPGCPRSRLWDRGNLNPQPTSLHPATNPGAPSGRPLGTAASSRHGWETTNPNRVPQARGPHGHRGPRRAIFARWGEVRSSSVGRRSRLWDLGPQHRARNRVNSTAPLFPANPIDNQMERR
jgi:hypothetical protein